MQITPVNSVLNPIGLEAPVLNALVPNQSNYRVILMQPRGQIEASGAGVRNRDHGLARRQFGSFLQGARECHGDLVITPEYSMPWDILVETLEAGNIPSQGRLWALGCESITLGELEAVKQRLAPHASVIYEPLVAGPERFTDPLAYVFVAQPVQGGTAERVVVLVQFKTCPMADDDHFEVNGLQLGTLVYQFGGIGPHLKLVSLICSDAFEFLDAHAEAVYDRALVLHIQLNPKPRQEQFRQYRDRLLRFSGDETELICLNWARDIDEWHGDATKAWHNIAGSAWYLRPDKFDQRDDTLCANHRRGLYYTWLRPLRTHALFLNFEPAVYLLEATKVAHIGVPAVMSRRRGPQLTKVSVWHEGAGAWVEQVSAEDGFAAVVGESGPAKDEMERIASGNPLAAERVLALCAGRIKEDDWYDVRRLDSCVIESSEIIQRITFCQDTDEGATAFRVARLKRCGHLWNILKTDGQLPPALADLKIGFRLEWSHDFPHQNAISTAGQRATVIYMGEDASTSDVDKTATRVAENLRRAFADKDARMSARQRLAVWFRGQEVSRWDPERYVKFDQSDDTSEFDIGRER